MKAYIQPIINIINIESEEPIATSPGANPASVFSVGTDAEELSNDRDSYDEAEDLW